VVAQVTIYVHPSSGGRK